MRLFIIFDTILLLLFILGTALYFYRKYTKKPVEPTVPADKSIFKTPVIEYVDNPNPRHFPVEAGTTPELAIENHPGAEYVKSRKIQAEKERLTSDDIAVKSILPFEQGGLNMNNNSTNFLNM